MKERYHIFRIFETNLLKIRRQFNRKNMLEMLRLRRPQQQSVGTRRPAKESFLWDNSKLNYMYCTSKPKYCKHEQHVFKKLSIQLFLWNFYLYLLWIHCIVFYTGTFLNTSIDKLTADSLVWTPILPSSPPITCSLTFLSHSPPSLHSRYVIYN